MRAVFIMMKIDMVIMMETKDLHSSIVVGKHYGPDNNGVIFCVQSVKMMSKRNISG